MIEEQQESSEDRELKVPIITVQLLSVPVWGESCTVWMLGVSNRRSPALIFRVPDPNER